METILDEELPRSRLAVLLKHFSRIEDGRQSWRVAFPLAEMLLLLTCATIADCDDFDEIVAWGSDHLDFLRRLAPFHFGIPCARWLRTLVNRLDPLLFGSCFESWIKELWPGRHDLIAIDGKTSRHAHDKRKGLKALHTLSAYATNARLVMGQLGVPEKANEITAIPELLDHLAEAEQLEGALVTIDAMGCQVAIADKIVEHKADSCSPSRATSQPSKPRSPITSIRLRQKNSSSTTRKLKRGTAASRCEPTPLHRMSTGLSPPGVTPVSRASPI